MGALTLACWRTQDASPSTPITSSRQHTQGLVEVLRRRERQGELVQHDTSNS